VPIVPPALIAALNPEQAVAAAAPTGPVRILAGAGTGKTRTITHRIAGQIASGAFAPSQIQADTFTERAAAEMRGRIAALVAGLPGDGPPPAVRTATFHAAAWAQVRHFWPALVEAGQAPAAGGALPEVLTSKIPLLVPAARRLRVDAADLAAEVEWAANADLGPDEVARSGRDELVDASALAEVLRGYQAEKDRRGAIDYEDMLRLARRLMAIDGPAATVRERYRAFTVDEFQDTNTLQWRLLQAWVGDRDDVCVVGDPAQTIFSFTGADSRYLDRFDRAYPGTTTVRLDRSYRSTPQVLAVTNRILGRRATDLRATVGGDGAPDPVLAEQPDGDAEVAFVIGAVRRLLDDGTPAREIALCYRINAQAAEWEDALRRAGIPVLVRGEGSFYDRAEVKQAVRALQAAVAAPPPPGPPPIVDAPVVNANVAQQAEAVFRDALSWRPGRPPEGRRARERWEAIEAVHDEVADLADGGLDLPAIAAELGARVLAGADHTADAVTLTSLHRAKGLEFDAVFLVAVEEGLLPISFADTDEEVDEERRLLYVGATRARRWLSITWARSRPSRSSGKPTSRRPSRFLYGLGDGAPTPGAPKAAAGRATRAGKVSLDDLPDDADPILVDRLRTWRRERAAADQVPAFVVFSDATLVDLATRRPTDRRTLLLVKGVGPAKADRYGADLLAAIAGRG
jgi:DNA helicase-2/ATP-dependent DNA helicase PcrA